MTEDLLARLRSLDLAAEIAAPPGATADACLAEWHDSGVAFAASDPAMERQYWRAVRELFTCVKPTAGLGAILNEGGIYFGCWLESTGTISSEILSRFLPDVAARTFLGFARTQRDDGLFPYKLTEEGPVFNQIQIVSPLARSVWTHYRINGRDKAFLAEMYRAMSAYDDWIARFRDTRATGAVEAFCCYDTGHDLSARFWHVPDAPYRNDPARCDPDNPLVPFVAPDLTANIACQRSYLAEIAEELGEDGAGWAAKAAASTAALFAQCFDEADGFFYDRDRHGRLVRIQSDVLLRVLACEIGDDAFFAGALERYLINTGKFFAKYPFTSLALSDPRFDPSAGYNTWCGAPNLLSFIRAPHAFEAHHRHVELTFALQPVLSALMRADRFAQTIDPFTGTPGFSEVYATAMLGLIDGIERLSGILPRADGALWFTGLVPKSVRHRQVDHETAYARRVDGIRFELVNAGDAATIYRNGQLLYHLPAGIRLVTGRDGRLRALIGMSVATVSGTISGPDGELPVSLGPNQRLDFRDGRLVEAHPAGYVPISH